MPLEVPWYMLSPSPYSLTVWSTLALIQTKKLKPYSLKQWMYGFAVCAFTLGLIVMPFDSLWVIFQNMRFGHLYPEERYITLFTSLSRNLLIFLLCIYETREICDKLNIHTFFNLYWFLPIFTVWFRLAPDPSWTDWTYAYRFNYGPQRTIEAFIISHMIMKTIQAAIYFDLWKVKIN